MNTLLEKIENKVAQRYGLETRKTIITFKVINLIRKLNLIKIGNTLLTVFSICVIIFSIACAGLGIYTLITEKEVIAIALAVTILAIINAIGWSYTLYYARVKGVE